MQCRYRLYRCLEIPLALPAGPQRFEAVDKAYRELRTNLSASAVREPVGESSLSRHRHQVSSSVRLCVLVWGMHMAKKSKKSDLRRARERIYKQLLKRSHIRASTSTARARQRHAQLIARRASTNPALV